MDLEIKKLDNHAKHYNQTILNWAPSLPMLSYFYDQYQLIKVSFDISIKMFDKHPDPKKLNAIPP